MKNKGLYMVVAVAEAVAEAVDERQADVGGQGHGTASLTSSHAMDM